MNQLFLTTVLVFLLSACSPLKHEHIAEGGRSETGEPALHAVHDNELRNLMDRMDSLMQERFMTETQLDSERRKFSRRIADSAQDLSKTIDTIIAKLPNLTLTPAEQATFLALANKLRQQTEQLQQQARQNHIDAIDDGLHQINTTCTSCHALFRKTDS